ncbi:hypothetical protein [Actinosynnema sp. NPDC023587]|uniref:WXG100 family type VII secretion target n=1 Tax=Actinosynnema sp. NPDC023587 TaxID=3154695 RepID=UPI0033DB7272
MTAPETPIAAPPGMEITEENKFKGSLFVEAFDGLIDSIGKDAESETERVLDITFNAIGAASSVAMFAMDPFGSILGAGIGWLIEHISFIREGFDQLMGDPDDINANVEATKKQAVEMRVLAQDHRQGLATFDGWTGQASERFQASMEAMGQELDNMAGAIETKAKIVAVCGMLVQVLRDIVRDLIAQFLGGLLAGALAAAALAIPTFGASIAAFIGFAVGKGIALATNVAARIARLIAALTRNTKRIDDLDGVVKKIGKGWDRFENIADVGEIGWEGYKAQDDVDKKIDKGLKDDDARDKVDKDSEAANKKYEDAKKDEQKEADELKTANEELKEKSDRASEANKRASAAADEVNRAAASGDQAAFDQAKAKYDAAKADADAARADAAEAAKNSAGEARDLADASKRSNEALDATKPTDEAAKKAYEEYKQNNPGGQVDPARTAAENDLSTKNDAAKQANAKYEQANVDFTEANAKAAEANAKAFASGSEADIAAAERASKAAEDAGRRAEAAAAEAKASGEAAGTSYKDYKAKYDNKSGGQTPSPDAPTTQV